jgi:O-antigen/teichoic acid export membrane protein
MFASGLGSLVLGLTFAVVAPHVSGHFREMSHTPGQALLFVGGVVLTGVSLVFDQATIGLLRGGTQLSRNLVFATAKLLALPAVAITLRDGFGAGIALSWTVGTALSLMLVALGLRVKGTRVLPRPDWHILRGLGKTALAHNWLNLSITVPQTLIPVLVTVVVSPAANGAFYAAWTLCGFLKVIPAHLATVLFAVAAADPLIIARKLRFTLRLSFLIGLPGMAALALGAHFALTLFGPSYAQAATLPLLLLILGYIPSVPKVHYMAVCRATGHIPRAAAVLTVAATMEVAAVAVGGASGGLKGLSIALLAVYIAEGLVTTPPVLRAAIGHGRHRRDIPADEVTGDFSLGTWRATGAVDKRLRSSQSQVAPPQRGTLVRAAHDPAPTGSDKKELQEAGIAALLSLARSVAATGPVPVVMEGLLPVKKRSSANVGAATQQR